MSNFLSRLNIEMEKRVFSFLLVFLIIFFGVDITTILIINLKAVDFQVIYWFIIPLIITLIFAGVIIDKAGKCTWFLILLIPEGLLTIVLGINVTDPTTEAILWVLIAILAGFTMVAILGFFVDKTAMNQRGKVGGLVFGIAWVVAAVLLSWYSSGIYQNNPFAASLLLYIFAIIKLIGGGISIYLLIRKTEAPGESSVSFQASQPGFVEYLKESYRFIWADKKFILYLIAFILIWMAQGIYTPIGGFRQVPPAPYQSMASIGFAAGSLFLITTGAVIDQQGRKQMLIYGTILAVISFLSCYFPLGDVFLAGFSLVIATIIILLGDIAPGDAKGRYYSIFLLSNFLAFLIGYIIGSASTSNLDWVVLACIIITAIALLLIFWKGQESIETSGVKLREKFTPITTKTIEES